MMTERMLVVVVTGLSGAGKSTAINALEDLGFFCVDNLPPPVIAATLDACARGGVARVGLGIDVRTKSFTEAVETAIDAVPDDRRDLAVVFLDASDDELLRRYSGTRRPHPLTANVGQEGPIALLDGIRLERQRLIALRARATLVIDTAALSVHELRRRLIDHFGPVAGKTPRMRVRFVSFGFTRGLPMDGDLVFDVRFLPNPFFVDSLRPLSGQSPMIHDYLQAFPDCQEFMRRTRELLEFLIPRFESEGKAYLTVAFGCTGGRHRSVAMVELIKAGMESSGFPIDAVHRDVELAYSEGQVLTGSREPFDGC
ncbi:RNase adapter RapZ [Myxococcota bacterium]